MMKHSANEQRQPAFCPDIVALGESMLTIRPHPSQATFEWEVSGAESNVARYCAALGIRSSWISQLGTDLAGDLVLSTIENAGVDVSEVRRLSDRQTGLMLKEVTANGRRVRYYRAGSAAAAMDPSTKPAFSHRPQILHLTGITLGLSDSCNRLVQSLIKEPQSALVSFDINWRPAIWNGEDPSKALREVANRCDIVFVGLDEASELWGANTAAEVRSVLAQPKTVVVKDADNGAYAHECDTTHFVPALNGTVVEPVGAGDAFAAGFIVGTLRYGDIRAALRLGHITAMSALSQQNDVGPIANESTIERLLDLSPENWLSANLVLADSSDGAKRSLAPQ